MKVEVGFIEEFSSEERDVIKNGIGGWQVIPVEKFVKVLEKVGKDDWAEIIKEKSEAYGFDTVQYSKVKTDSALYEVFNDSKNWVVIKSPLRVKKKKSGVKVDDVKGAVRKSGSSRGKKKAHVLELAQKFLEQRGGEAFTIGDFMKWLKDVDGQSYYRPYVYNVLKKNCVVEYREVGRRNVIFVKAVKA